MEGVTISLVEDIDELMEFKRWLGERRDWLAVDVETDGLRWWDGKLRLVQFGDAHRSFAIPWEWWPKAVNDAMAQYEGPVVGHNFKFDLHWLERLCSSFTPRWDRSYDTMIMAHLHEPHLRAGLKEVASRHVHPNAAHGERVLKAVMAQNGWDWATVPIDHPAYWGYACIDTVLTARLAAKLYPIVSQTRGYMLDLEHQVQAVLSRMESRGAVIDREYAIATSQRFQTRVQQFESWAATHYGIDKLGSNDKVIQKLGSMGWNFTKTTEKGKLALDDEVLLTIIRDAGGEMAELATVVRSTRKLKKLISTYLDKFVELADSDGILHCSIRQLGARTGRMSVATPSLQNLPRNEEVRSCFVPRAGHRLVLSDFDQIEIRLLAHFCKDPGLISAILDPSIDVHTRAARLIYSDPELSKSDPRRTITKNAVFAKVYGAGAAKFALTAKISEAEAARFMADYDSTFPAVPNFIGYVQHVARERRKQGDAFVQTPLGRLESLGGGTDFYKLVNYLIQGTAADIMKTQLVALDAAGLGQYMVLPVHDEIIMDVPESEIKAVSEIIQREMPILDDRYTVPITSDLAVVERWGDKYKGGNTWIDEAFEDVFAEEMVDG